jgi:tRNA dimethylallyltransferase
MTTSASAIRPAVYLAGPTASGKSAIALHLAAQIGGEIISVDSMQVYRGLDIGTAKPTAAERARVPHHLLDVAELNDAFDAAKFVSLAKKADAEIRARARVPIYCGGTGLYFRALIEGIGDAPAPDLRLRAELESAPLETLLAELEHDDPETFRRIDRNNPRRVVRAVEVIRLTGKKFSSQRAEWGAAENKDAATLIAIQRDAADLHQRINSRVDAIFAEGLVEETRNLMSRGLTENKTAMQAIGYRQVVEHLRGERSLAATIELVKTKTRQYAKRQMTWFRRQQNVRWIQASPIDSVAKLGERFLQAIG